MKYQILTFLLLAIIACHNPSDKPQSIVDAKHTDHDEGEWIPLFNGNDLTGWTPKFAKSEYGENYKNTFQVEDGKIVVKYDEYKVFDSEFGHLFYKDSLANYHLRLEYRFVGEQCPNGPGWAYKNSGVMYHCQKPTTVEVEQSFPISLEGQFLGGNGSDPRPTGNLCTPATHVAIDGELVTSHCIESNSKTIADTSWVLAEFIVKGQNEAYHLIDGDTVFHYTNPIYGSKEELGEKFTNWNGKPVKGGWIALQAESHPLEFRRIEIRHLDNF